MDLEAREIAIRSRDRTFIALAVLGLESMVVGSIPLSAWAQEAPPEVGSEADSSSSGDAQRLRQLQRIIDADKARLAETREDLARRERFFDQLTASIEEGKQEIAELRDELQQMGGAEASEEAAALAAEITGHEELLEVTRKQSEITFQSFKTLQNQMQALERKIAEDEKDLRARIGPPDEGPAEESAPGAQPTETGEVPIAAPDTSGQMLLPGVELSSAAPAEPTDSAAATTPEQIEARREADQAEQEARRAERAVVSFVERKRALENQIEIEQQLLETARESRTNLDLALESAQARLDSRIDSGATKAELEAARGTVDTVEQLLQENRDEIDERRGYLDSLRERLEILHEEQLTVTRVAEAKRQEAEAARKRNIWLQSPLHPTNLWRWISTRGPRMLLVVVVAWVLLLLVRLSARGVAKTVVGKRRTEQSRGINRADTLALSFRSAFSLLIVVAGVLLVFQEAGVDIKTVLGGAAILGVALAFGAQNLMRDYFTGFMILLEDQYELGDLITVGTITGRVEKVNMRTTVLRDLEGRVHFIPNGEIKAVTNRTYVWGRAVLEVPIGYREDVDRAMAAILEAADEFRADSEVGEWVTDDPVMLGVDKFTDQGVIIKFMIQTKPDKIFTTRREMLRRVKKKFDAKGIRISVPHRIVIRDPDEELGPSSRTVASAPPAENEATDEEDDQ